ncbi:MAG: AEC family transporter [Acidimicrobiales bacterium]
MVGIVAIGAATAKRLGIDVSSLSRLAYWVLGPAFVFDIFASSNLSGGIALRLAAAGTAGLIASLAAVGAGYRVWRGAWSKQAADLMTAAYGNVGNAGLAISIFALGEGIVDAAGVLMLTINALGMIVGISVAASQTTTPLAALRRALLAPMTIAAGIAIIVNLASIRVPTVVDRSVGLLAGALIPLMLYSLGAQLGATAGWAPTKGLGLTAVAKLMVAPAVAVVVARSVGLTGDLVGVVAIQSAMPPAVFCLVVANEHNFESVRVTANVVAVTLLSLLTLPVVLIVFGR